MREYDDYLDLYRWQVFWLVVRIVVVDFALSYT